jgi:hypothetical protein
MGHTGFTELLERISLAEDIQFGCFFNFYTQLEAPSLVQLPMKKF